MIITKQVEQWAHGREQIVHIEALQTYGERILLRNRWRTEDFLAGRVGRCLQCHAGATTAVQARVSAVYKQSGDSRCTSCYGIGFAGGFEPVVWITYMLAQDVDSDETKKEKSGDFDELRPQAQFPGVPPIDIGDLVIRVLSWANPTTPGTLGERSLISNKGMTETIRTGLRTSTDTLIVNSQTAQLFNLPADHMYYSVPITS